MGTSIENKFKNAFLSAKACAKNGNAAGTRAYVIKCMEVLRELYENTRDAVERKKIFVRIVEFQRLSAELYERGLTANVKNWFGISEQSPKSTSTHFKDMTSWTEEVFRENCRSVVTMRGTSTNVHYYGAGTGFIISENGYLLTNHHVVYDEDNDDYYESIYITPYGDNKKYRAEVIAADKKHDVALCSFDASDFENGVRAVRRIADYSEVSPGANVLVIGNGLGMGLAPISGMIKFTKDDDDNLVTTVPLNEGDSGSPVFNTSGVCIGINKSVTTSVTSGNHKMTAQCISNATPMSVIDRILDGWCKKYNIIL